MKATALRGRRTITAAFLVIAGGAVSAAVWKSGDHGFAVGLAIFYVVCTGVAYIWSAGSGDVAAILRVGGDERQRTIDQRATAVSGLALGSACLIGAVVDLARGGDGNPFAWLCAVGGGSYVLALAWIKRRS